jgi:uroporphyrinogen III methyltransferase/synthase
MSRKNSKKHIYTKKSRASNRVYLVGAGPGRPDLITVRGLNILREADVIIYDYLVDRRILENAREDAELICCDTEVSVSRRDPSKRHGIRDKLGRKRYRDGFLVHQQKINDLLIKKAKEGKKVVRLKNGNPTIFGRCSQELKALVKEKIEFEIVPGITAASAASAYSGIPLTDRRFASSCIFVAGHEDPTKKKSFIDWQAVAKSGTVVLYMAVGNLANIVKQMLKAGKDKNTDVAIVESATSERQKILTGTLKNIAGKAKEQTIKSPAIIIIGKVVKLGKKFNWLKRNKKILFSGLSQERFFAKNIYFHLPLIKIEPLENYDEFDNYLKNVKDFDWIVFSSRYGVEYFFKRLKAISYDSRGLNGIKIAVIGSSTKRKLLDFGIIADLIPKDESSKGLLKAFAKLDIRGKKIFLPRSNLADKGLKKGLTKLGAKVSSSFVYKNVIPKDLPELDLSGFDEIILTSPSIVRNFKKRYKKSPKSVKIKCIGDVTLEEAKECRLLN